MRWVASMKHGIKGPNGQGSEYWFYDVPHGVAHGEVNLANVDVIEQEIQHCLKAGISPEQVTVLTWSEAQKDAVRTKLESIQLQDGTSLLDSIYCIACVDYYANLESDVVICDLVVADARTGYPEPDSPMLHQSHRKRKKERQNKKARKTKNASSDDSAAHDFVEQRPKALLTRVLHKHRLIFGLTRARYGLIVIGQGVALMRTSKVSSRTGHESSHAAALVRDAFLRHCYVRDVVHMDSSPAAVRRHKEMGSEAVEEEAERLERERYRFFCTRSDKASIGRKQGLTTRMGQGIYHYNLLASLA